MVMLKHLACKPSEGANHVELIFFCGIMGDIHVRLMSESGSFLTDWQYANISAEGYLSHSRT